MANRNTVEILLSAKDQASKVMQSTFSGVQKSSKIALGAVAAGVATAGAALGALTTVIAKTGISYNAMAESSQVAWNTLLGTQEKAKKMVKDIADFAKNTQFDSQSVDIMAKYMHNAGYEGKNLFDQLTKIADVSGAFNISADSAQELARQMSQVQQAGVAYTEDLNILQDRGVPIYKAIAEQLDTTVASVKNMASKGELTADIYTKAFDDIANSVKGASAAQAETFTGMISTIKDQLSILAGALAKPLFEKLKAGMEKLQPALDALVSYASGDMKGFTKTMDETFGNGAGQKMLGFANGLKTAVDGVKNGLSTLKSSLTALFDFGKGDMIGGITILTKMGLSPETITKVVKVVNVIKSTISGFVKDYIGYIKGLFYGEGNLGESFSKIFNTAKSIVMPILTDIISFVKDKIAMIKQFWDENGAQITQAIKNAWSVIAAIFKFIAPVILFILQSLWENVKGVIDGTLKIIMGVIKVFAGLFTGDFSKMWEGIKQLFVGALQFVWNLVNLLLVGKLLGSIKSFITQGVSHFTGFWTKAVEIFKNLDTYLWNIVKTMVSKVVGFFKNLYTEGAQIFGTLKTFGANTFSAMWQAIKAVASNIASGVKNYFLDLFTGAKFHMDSLLSKGKEIFASVKEAITSPIQSAKEFITGKFDDIVAAAQGLPGRIGSGIASLMDDATDAIGDLADKLIKKFKKALGIASPSKVFTQMGGHIIDGLVNGLSVGNLKDLGTKVFSEFGGGIFNTFGKIKGFLTGSGSGGNVSSWITQALAITGAPSSWLGPLSTLVQHESGGNPKAINLWDSNAKKGTPSKGLFQTIDPTFNRYKMPGMNDIWNPIHNAVAGIRYIMARYGNVYNVPGIKSMMGGGGYKGYYMGARVTNKQLAWVAEKGPEYVIPTDSGQRAFNLWQQAGKENGFIGNGGASAAINVTLNYTGSGSQDDAYTMIDIIEKELYNRLGNSLRLNGVK